MATSHPLTLSSTLSGIGRATLRAASALDHHLSAPPPTRLIQDSGLSLHPAAIRIERTHSRGRGRAAQTAVTMWFGQGPALPTPGLGESAALRGALRLGAGLLAAAALGALTVAAERRVLHTTTPAQLIDTVTETRASAV